MYRPGWQGPIRARVVIVLLLLLNMDAQAVKIAAFGDSITRGYPYYTNNADGFANNGGYVPSLQSQLNAANWAPGESITVYNWGYPGELVTNFIPGTTGGRDRFPSPVLNTAGKEPDYVLIMEGTNDLSAGIGPSAVGNRLNQIVTEVIDAGRIPMIGTLLPRFDGKVSSSSLTSANTNIKSIGNDRDITVVDLYAGDGNWTHWNSMMTDSLHPNLTGYALMANIWFDALARYKEELDRLAAIEQAIKRAKIAGAVSAVNLLLLLDD